MNDYLQKFFEDPTNDAFLGARRAILDDSAYQTLSTDLAALSELHGQGLHRQVLKKVEQMLPLWSLSPRVHFLSALSAEALGIAEEVESSRYLMHACIEGLLSTGNGTEEKPFLITYLSDEQDLLLATGRQKVSQSLVEGEQRLYDVIDCQDGTTVWFEVNDLLLTARPRPQAKQRLRVPH